jgi:hypothetical protein
LSLVLKKQGRAMVNTQNTQRVVEMEEKKPPEDKVEYIQNWIEKVSLVRPELGGFSICPFAKKSTYKIVECPIGNITSFDGYDVVIYIIDESDLDKIRDWCEEYNNKYNDWLFFEDCASYDTFINGVQTNNGRYNLILGQPKDKLMKFRDILKKTEYYSYWSKDYYDEIVGD